MRCSIESAFVENERKWRGINRRECRDPTVGMGTLINSMDDAYMSVSS